VTGPPRIFLDASVWIAAAGSARGASAAVLDLCHRGNAVAVGSRIVLLEAERNIRTKLGEEALLRFYQRIGWLELEVAESPTAEEMAAADKAGVEYLLTFDRRHFFSDRVTNARLQFRIITPGDFLRTLLR